MNKTNDDYGAAADSYNVEISDFIDVASKAEALDCNIPTGIALLPRNFASASTKGELIHESSVSEVRSLWRQAEIIETPLESRDERFPQVSEHGLEVWIGPTITVTAAWLSQNPQAMSVALGVISNYLTDIFRGLDGMRNVKLGIAVETRNGESRKIDYDGPVKGLRELPAIIDKVVSND